MKKIILAMAIFGIFFLSSSLAQEAANTPGALFYQANINYQEAKYDSAIKNYARIINSGFESGNIYYNLGNSYFKKGELGLAVLNYERAKVLIPNDSDLSSNYDYVLHTLNLEPQLFGGWFEKTVHALFQGQSIDALTILLSIVYIFLIGLFILNLFYGRLRTYLGWIISILVILFILSAYALSKRIDYLNKGAIVISKEADVKFEPLENATTYFKVGEGSKVEVVEKAEGWYKVRRFDNKLGWVNKEVLEKIR